jgi:hypothetical protein
MNGNARVHERLHRAIKFSPGILPNSWWDIAPDIALEGVV